MLRRGSIRRSVDEGVIRQSENQLAHHDGRECAPSAIRAIKHDAGRCNTTDGPCIVLLVGRHPINDLTPSIWSRARTWKIGNIRGGTCNAGGQRGFTAVSREVLAETCSTRSRRSTINAITMNRLRAVTSCRRAGGRHDMPPNQACKW